MAPAALTVQRAFYIGNSLSGILYGIQFALCFQSIHYLKRRPNGLTTFYIVFSLALLFLNAVQLAANTLYGEYMWIERGPTTPGGPVAYFEENTTWWVNTFGTATSVAADVMSQALLLFRCYIITDSNTWIIFLPALMFVTSSALGIVSVIESALPKHFLLSGAVGKFGVPWISISVSFNVVVTAIISSRLMYAHRQLKNVTLVTHNRRYAGVTAIMVESALPLAVAGILFAVFYGKNSRAAIAFGNIWGSMVGISPQLIIFRLSKGIAWKRDTIGTGPSMHFAAQNLTQAIDIELGSLENKEINKSFRRT
ncbi:hypothetical protein CPB84DRAFT_1797216 [Gymnopilus junonius]|uniref:Uncharacterized protein n=1 Tax=Gymnopilus junonius TaxID=109634 RepID=A0A9P5NBZ2_GYMJU|nr:hypothetical protein CPB84DRAFT_1797216 [Gymnopilus junonius]